MLQYLDGSSVTNVIFLLLYHVNYTHKNPLVILTIRSTHQLKNTRQFLSLAESHKFTNLSSFVWTSMGSCVSLSMWNRISVDARVSALL